MKIRKLNFLTILILLIQGCSQYKSSWSCKNPEGIGCSSITYADEVARKHIILNEEKRKSKKVLIKEHYSDFKKYRNKVIEIK